MVLPLAHGMAFRGVIVHPWRDQNNIHSSNGSREYRQVIATTTTPRKKYPNPLRTALPIVVRCRYMAPPYSIIAWTVHYDHLLGAISHSATCQQLGLV